MQLSGRPSDSPTPHLFFFSWYKPTYICRPRCASTSDALRFNNKPTQHASAAVQPGLQTTTVARHPVLSLCRHCLDDLWDEINIYVHASSIDISCTVCMNRGGFHQYVSLSLISQDSDWYITSSWLPLCRYGTRLTIGLTYIHPQTHTHTRFYFLNTSAHTLWCNVTLCRIIHFLCPKRKSLKCESEI